MLHHVSLEVRPEQVEPCVRFWELLGFRQITPPPILRHRYTWVERDGTHIHLIPTDSPAVPVEGHAAVAIDDPEATLAALREAGLEPQPGSNAWNAPRWFVRDPAGHLVELMSAPPVPPWPGE
jgi:catechol 2,3-dioxygenase-like lactoylglutathione lyase family enzyme